MKKMDASSCSTVWEEKIARLNWMGRRACFFHLKHLPFMFCICAAIKKPIHQHLATLWTGEGSYCCLHFPSNPSHSHIYWSPCTAQPHVVNGTLYYVMHIMSLLFFYCTRQVKPCIKFKDGIYFCTIIITHPSKITNVFMRVISLCLNLSLYLRLLS